MTTRRALPRILSPVRPQDDFGAPSPIRVYSLCGTWCCMIICAMANGGEQGISGASHCGENKAGANLNGCIIRAVRRVGPAAIFPVEVLECSVKKRPV